MDRQSEDAALIDVTRAIVGIATAAADELGAVSVVQLRALTVLGELAPASLGQLAEGIGVTPSTTSRLVDRLVSGGFAERRPSPESRRQIELRLTTEGEATLARYDELRLRRLRTALERVPGDRRDAVVEALAEFSGAVRPGREPVPAGS
jgi:DNA-binding MarR family transcriptional regulator